MFNFFKPKPDYKTIFSSPPATYNLIYGDRAKTADVLGDQAFIQAWLASPNKARISAQIDGEARKGDVPSIKQMSWYAELVYRDSMAHPNILERRAIQKSALTHRIFLEEMLVSMGMANHAYRAMVSSANLYSIIESESGTDNMKLASKVLAGIVRNAKMFLESGSEDEPGMFQDAKTLLAHYEGLANVMAAVHPA